MAMLRITVATQAELLEGLAAGREDDDSTDFWGCIDASDTGRRQALVVLNEYIMRKTKEERERMTMQSVETPESPIQRQAEHVKHASQSPQAIQRENTMPTLQLSSEATQETPKSRTFSFLRSSAAVVQPRPIQPTRPTPVTLQSDGGLPSPLHARTLTGITLVSDDRRRITTRRTSSPQRQSVASTNSFLQTSDGSNIISGSTSPISPSIPESTLGATSITSYGGCCKYAHHLRDGNTSKSLRRQNAAFSPGATKINFVCQSTKCNFQIQAFQNKKRDWVVDDRPQLWRRTLQYTPIFLAKSHLPTLAPLLEQKKSAQYRCIICILLNDRANLFRGQDALLEHVLGHVGASLNGVRVAGPLTFSNNGVSIRSDFDIDLPEKDPNTNTLNPTPTHVSDAVADMDLQHELEKSEMNSKRSSNATQDMDPYFSPWAD